MDSAPPAAPASTLVQFCRFWCANMDLVHSKGQSWPGFGYTDDEKARMHDVAATVPTFEFYSAVFFIVVFVLAFAALCIGLMFWRLQLKYGGDPSKTPGAEFFLMLALAGTLTIGAGLPIGIFIAAWLTARLFRSSASSPPDREFAVHIVRKSVRQIVRMGFCVSAAVLIYSLFVPADSKINLILTTVMPVLAPIVSFLSGIYYFSGRNAAPAASSK